MSRLFVDADLAAGIDAPLAAAQVHYLRHVMRRPDGAPLLLFNGRDGEWRATLESRGKKVAVEAVKADIDAGAPVGADGRMNLVNYAAWLVKEVQSR